jgi:predicted phage gp36 major capsid-like protein
MSNEQPHDPTVTLRLELGRVTDQRNAYEAALRKEVMVVIREAAAENAYLKAEVERLKNNCEYLDQKLDEEIERSASFAGEISRLNDAIMTGNAITPDARIVP